MLSRPLFTHTPSFQMRGDGTGGTGLAGLLESGWEGGRVLFRPQSDLVPRGGEGRGVV